MGIAGGLWRVETRGTPSVSFSIPVRRWAFCPDGSFRRSFRPPRGGSLGEGTMALPLRVEYLDAERMMPVLVRKAVNPLALADERGIVT